MPSRTGYTHKSAHNKNNSQVFIRKVREVVSQAIKEFLNPRLDAPKHTSYHRSSDEYLRHDSPSPSRHQQSKSYSPAYGSDSYDSENNHIYHRRPSYERSSAHHSGSHHSSPRHSNTHHSSAHHRSSTHHSSPHYDHRHHRRHHNSSSRMATATTHDPQTHPAPVGVFLSLSPHPVHPILIFGNETDAHTFHDHSAVTTHQRHGAPTHLSVEAPEGLAAVHPTDKGGLAFVFESVDAAIRWNGELGGVGRMLGGVEEGDKGKTVVVGEDPLRV
ncbi:hypothetical protein BDY21DRAFT_349025 [Lineolata rhizophorae]|uniref:Uncharacterized protein n=1 Tax=Lineolata rhizophorae TaxID=578093 RepID=A0A6A6NWM1_9PEZI|nr:hypothetical protein BDY21DRAFT_349025 [Lineolata rhizophorae]